MRPILLALILAFLLPVPAIAQKKVTISVDIDGAGSDMISSLVRREIRKFSDVHLVEKDQNPMVFLHGIAMCIAGTGCTGTSVYITTFQTYTETGKFAAKYALDAAGLTATPAQIDTVASLYKPYVSIESYTLHSWPRAKVEESVMAYVAELDTKCFEKYRILMSETTLSPSAVDKLKKTQWMC